MKSLFSQPPKKTLISLLKSARTLKSDAIEDSPVYLRSMLRRPPALAPWNVLRNSCSFIGTVIRSVKRFGSDGSYGAYTVLEVKTPSRDSDPPPFTILLHMRDKLSEISMRHLKPNDYVYVYGSLSSYKKLNASGNCEIFYKVVVTELNFVRQRDATEICHKPEDADAHLTPSASCESDIQEASYGASGNERERRDRLRLWQVFLASPHEWWDNRQNKKDPHVPDFKHKDTKECLWLRPDDPPWVRKQLQLYDSSTGGARVHHGRSLEWELDDYV